MNLDEARKYFENDKWATDAAGIVIESVDGYNVICSMEISPVHRNALGGVMGGAIYTLADFAFAVSSNTEDIHTVTTVTTANFLGGAKGEKLIATTSLVKDGRRTCMVEVTVKDELDNLVAIVSCNGMHV